jgi:hypothetical protein
MRKRLLGNGALFHAKSRARSQTRQGLASSGPWQDEVDSVSVVTAGAFGVILATASRAFSMARATSAINCFRSVSALSSFVACAFIGISPFATPLKGIAWSIERQSEDSLKTLAGERIHERRLQSSRSRPLRTSIPIQRNRGAQSTRTSRDQIHRAKRELRLVIGDPSAA